MLLLVVVVVVVLIVAKLRGVHAVIAECRSRDCRNVSDRPPAVNSNGSTTAGRTTLGRGRRQV